MCLWGHRLVTSSAQDRVSETATAAQSCDLGQIQMWQGLNFLVQVPAMLSEVSAGSERRPRGQVTLDWNGSVLRAPSPPPLPT